MEKCIALVDGIRCNRNQKNSTNPNCDAHYRHLRKWGEYREIGNMGPRGVLSMRDPSGRKQCRRCLGWKTIDFFHNSPSSPDALQSLCKSCSNATVLNSYYNAGGYNPEKKMKSRYGLSLDEYEKKFLEQGGGCAICGKHEKAKVLAVDHDHGHCPGRLTCGKCVRDLLCTKCNVALGLVSESKEVLLKMITYIEKWGK